MGRLIFFLRSRRVERLFRIFAVKMTLIEVFTTSEGMGYRPRDRRILVSGVYEDVLRTFFHYLQAFLPSAREVRSCSFHKSTSSALNSLVCWIGGATRHITNWGVHSRLDLDEWMSKSSSFVPIGFKLVEPRRRKDGFHA